MAEKPGPVHLEFPEDVASEQVQEELCLLEQNIETAEAPASAIEKAARMIEKAKRPLLLIASACHREDVSDALRACIDGSGIYFFSTQMGKGVVDERHLQCLGSAALSEMDDLTAPSSRRTSSSTWATRSPRNRRL